MALLDLVFPKTCVNCGRVGVYICESCIEQIAPVDFQICPVCTRPSISGLTHARCRTKLSLDGLHSFVYYLAPVPQALYQIKYKFVKDFATDLIVNLNLNLPNLFSDFYLASVPLYARRENWRGFNQAQVLNDLLAESLNLSSKSDILVRKKSTKSQVGLSRRKRAENVTGAFECVDKSFAKDKKFLLFDDVWTSGATMRNCNTVLKRAGAEKVWGLTLARSR